MEIVQLSLIQVHLTQDSVVSPKGIHIVTAGTKRRKNIHLVRGAYFADVVTDTRSNPPVHHWIVQREGSPEVVHWGQEKSIAQAESAAASCLDDLNQRERKNA